MTPSQLYLLDTNVLVHFVRGSVLWQRIRDTYRLLTVEPTPCISLVSEGEIRSLALQWQWGKQKLDQMEFCLSFFQSQTIDDPEILQAYATLDAFCESIGQKMGKNDLWIAATASILGATLLTTDRDFDRLHESHLQRVWIDPDAAS